MLFVCSHRWFLFCSARLRYWVQNALKTKAFMIGKSHFCERNVAWADTVCVLWHQAARSGWWRRSSSFPDVGINHCSQTWKKEEFWSHICTVSSWHLLKFVFLFGSWSTCLFWVIAAGCLLCLSSFIMKEYAGALVYPKHIIKASTESCFGKWGSPVNLSLIRQTHNMLNGLALAYFVTRLEKSSAFLELNITLFEIISKLFFLQYYQLCQWSGHINDSGGNRKKIELL